MSIDDLGQILWRRRLTFISVLLLSVAAVVAVTLTLPKAYKSTATLYVGGEDVTANAYLGETFTRTYAALAGNANVADAVIDRYDLEMTRTELLRRMSFAPVEQTQLLEITAEAPSPAEAQELANRYADVIVDRVSGEFARGQSGAQVSVSERAALPTEPSKPNPPLYIGFGTLLALLAAFGITVLRERLDTRIRVAPEDDTALGQPIMARIPQFDARRGGESRQVADRFSVLKTNIDFFDEEPARAVVITSPDTDEGKSTIAANLAVACSADGERVVLIEADLRRPGLDNTVVAEAGKRSPVGLSNYLAGAATEDQILNEHPEYRGLSVIWSGLLPPNPTALLGSHRVDTLLAELRLDFDRIIIDTCPISVGADASVLASHVDGVLYVMDERQTKRSEAIAGLNQLRGVRARLLGTVLNRATIRTAEGYYYADRSNGASRARRSAEHAETESFS